MSPERWQQVKAIFNSAIQYQPEERAAFLVKACSGDSSLLNEVESLLRSHEQSGSFIDNPAYDLAQGVLNEKTELIQGKRIGNYEVLSFVGRGGMGEVYLAHDRRLSRKVALKLLPASSTQDADRLARFEHEARAASALNHPNILTIYEIQEIDSIHIIATEFIEGETLRQRLSLSPLSLREALNIAIQVADAVSAAHKAGIIHRDIKPENIMIRPDGYVKVLDFGLAKLIEPPDSTSRADDPTRKIQTGSGLILGTVNYMSPEQARAQTIDARSDIFSLGVLIYEMVAGEQPFEGDTTSDVMAAILKSDPTPLSHYLPEVPSELVRIVNKALRKDREERYQVSKDLLLDLKTLKEDIDFKAKMDRASFAATSLEPVGPPGVRSNGADSAEIKNAISTISNSLGVQLRRHKAVVAVLGIVLVALMSVGVLSVYKFVNRTEQEVDDKSQDIQTSQITFSPGLDGFPSLSPDGKSMVYSSDQNGNLDIYVKQLSLNGGELRLTNDGQQNVYPAWSPDGQRIAYCSKQRGGIWLISALGGNPKQLTEFGVRPAWSPDGTMIAFQSGVPGEIFASRTLAPSNIWTVPSSGGEPKQITRSGSPSGGHGSPTWSRDSKRIAFDSSDYLYENVWSVAVDGTDLKKIGSGSHPVFSHDGNSLYFEAIGLLKVQLSSSGDPVGEAETIFKIGPGIILGPPSISADGKRIVYAANRILSNLWTVHLSSSGEPTGPPQSFITDTSFRANLARFSADGKRLAFNRWRLGSSADIWVADADGKNLSQVTNNPATDSQASWFPDGSRLAFISDRSKQLQLWSISLTTGKEERLLDLGEVQFAQVSPDGKQIAFNAEQNGVINVWTASIVDGQRKQLTFGSDLMGFATWSPDGKYLAFEWQRGEDAYLMLMPSEGGPATQLTFERGKSWPHSWSGDGDKVAFAGQRNGVWNLYWISLSTKTEKQLTNNTKANTFLRYPAWSPQGDQIVYEYAEITSNIWMTELK